MLKSTMICVEVDVDAVPLEEVDVVVSVRPDWKFWPEPEPEPDCYDLAGTGTGTGTGLPS